MEKQAITNNDVDGTILIAIGIAIVPVNVVREVHAAGAVARLSEVQRRYEAGGCCD